MARVNTTLSHKRTKEYKGYCQKEGETTQASERVNLAASALKILLTVLDIYKSPEMQQLREYDGSTTLGFIKRAVTKEFNALRKQRVIR